MLLHLGDSLAGAATAPLRLQEQGTASAEQLRLLQSLDTARAQACGRACLQLAEQATTEHHQLWFERYLAELRRFIESGGGGERQVPYVGAAAVGYLWASPLRWVRAHAVRVHKSAAQQRAWKDASTVL